MKKQTQNVLSRSDREGLADARRRARRRAKVVEVGGYERPFYQLGDRVERRLARWEDLERAVFRLCGDIDRRGPLRGDPDRMQVVVSLLHDVIDHAADARRKDGASS